MALSCISAMPGLPAGMHTCRAKAGGPAPAAPAFTALGPLASDPRPAPWGALHVPTEREGKGSSGQKGLGTAQLQRGRPGRQTVLSHAHQLLTRTCMHMHTCCSHTCCSHAHTLTQTRMHTQIAHVHTCLLMCTQTGSHTHMYTHSLLMHTQAYIVICTLHMSVYKHRQTHTLIYTHTICLCTHVHTQSYA